MELQGSLKPIAVQGTALVLVACFGVIALGFILSRRAILGAEAKAGVSTLYAKLVFPTMVFRGVAAIDVAKLDLSVGLVMLCSKLIVAAVAVGYVLAARRGADNGTSLSHAAALAMAATHSFDVTMGAPLAAVLFPEQTAYVFLNQSVQLVLVNPLMLLLMEMGSGGGGASGGLLRRTLVGVATNPLVVMTLAGLAAGQAWPAGLPPALAALSKQVADAGPFLGFLSLGFATAALGGAAPSERAEHLAHAAVLAALKLVAMPALYAALAPRLGCDAPPPLLVFLGSLPASASVYSLAVSRNLSPGVVGPLVPATILLCAALNLIPLSPAAAGFEDALKAALGLAAARGAAVALRAVPRHAPAAAPRTAAARRRHSPRRAASRGKKRQ